MKNLAQLASHFRRAAKAFPAAIAAEVEDQGKAIEADAKSLFGTYQEGWRDLDDSTRSERVRLGYTSDDPLFRSGALRDAVTHKVEHVPGGSSVFVGVEPGHTMLQGPDGREVDAALVMGVQEHGSTDGRVPARPVFGTVAAHVDRFQHAALIGVMARTELGHVR